MSDLFTENLRGKSSILPEHIPFNEGMTGFNQRTGAGDGTAYLKGAFAASKLSHHPQDTEGEHYAELALESETEK